MKILNSVSSLFNCSLFMSYFFRIFDGISITIVVIIIYLFILLTFLSIDGSDLIAIRLLYVFLEVIRMNFGLIFALMNN